MPATYYNGTKLKNIYYNGTKLKKVYLDNVLMFSGGELEYYGTATALSKARQDLAATTVGNYALFGGGKVVDVYTVS